MSVDSRENLAAAAGRVLGDGQFMAEWMEHLKCNQNGIPFKIFENACIAVGIAPEIRDSIKYDDFARKKIVTGELPWSTDINRPWEDADTLSCRLWIQQRGVIVDKDTVRDAVEWWARENKFHPVRDYLNALKWDGKQRLNTWLSYYLGAEDTEYVREIGLRFLVAMVARIMSPGCKADYMLILEGDQGIGKSTACKILAGGDEYFSDCLPDITHKDANLHLSGKWIVEIAELAAISSRWSEVAKLKSFLTQTVDQFRPSYGREEVFNPRQCVFIGTTNEENYLRDTTGNRRFWPVRCGGSIDLEALAHDRDQLLAEAVDAFKSGEQWWPDREFERVHIAREQQARREIDPWVDTIRSWLERSQSRAVTIDEVLGGALGVQSSNIDRRASDRVARCLLDLGFERRRTNGKRMWVRINADDENVIEFDFDKGGHGRGTR